MKLSMKRAATFSVGAVVAAIALTGCGSSAGEEGEVTLIVWQREGGIELDEHVALFEKENPDISVKLSTVAGDQYLTKLANSVRAGSAPDVISFDIVNAPLLATQNLLADVTEQVQGLANLEDLAPAGVEIGQLDDKNYALPVGLTGSQMFWNKELFTQAGLDPDSPPTTLVEVKAAAEKIQALGADITGFSTLGGVAHPFTGLPSAFADGGQVFDAAGIDQKATFTDDSVVDMVTWYQDMWAEGLMQQTDEPNQDPGNVGLENAMNGKVGIIFTGANVLTPSKELFNSAAGLPGMDGELGSFLGGDEIAVTAGAKSPTQAWTLVEWLVSSEEAAEISNAQGWIAPDLAVAGTLAADPWQQNIVGALAVGQLPKSIAYNAVINDPNGPWAQASQDAIFQGADPESVLEAGQEQADQLIQDAYRQVGE